MFNSFTAAMAASAAAKVLQFYSSRSNDIFAKCRIPVTAKIKLLKRAAKNPTTFSLFLSTNSRSSHLRRCSDGKQTNKREEWNKNTDRQTVRQNEQTNEGFYFFFCCVCSFFIQGGLLESSAVAGYEERNFGFRSNFFSHFFSPKILKQD